MIPLGLHWQKLEEQRQAMKGEMQSRETSPTGVPIEQEVQDDIDAIFLRDISPQRRAELFRDVVAYYKDKPSADRAQLLQALTNKQAFQVAGVSSKTLANARKLDEEPLPAGKRLRLTMGGYSMEKVRCIAFDACLDPKFCQVRSWIEHSAQSETRRWESIGLDDVKTMWATLCKTHGEFCLSDSFRKAIVTLFSVLSTWQGLVSVLPSFSPVASEKVSRFLPPFKLAFCRNYGKLCVTNFLENYLPPVLDAEGQSWTLEKIETTALEDLTLVVAGRLFVFNEFAALNLFLGNGYFFNQNYGNVEARSLSRLKSNGIQQSMC